VLQVQLFEGATELQEFAIQFVKGVASVMTMHWGARVVNMALQCFADLSRLAHHLCEGNDVRKNHRTLFNFVTDKLFALLNRHCRT
jgi:hypothetical protein